MISELMQRVRVELDSRRYPYALVYGPERAQRKGYTPAGIVFRRDREQGDDVGPPVGWKGSPDPRMLFTRRFRGVVEIYVRASRPNAGIADHEDECDRVCDGVLCALYRASTGFLLQVSESRLLRAEELEGQDHSEVTGCAARIRFSLASPVLELDYTGDGPATAEVAAVDLTAVTSADFPDYDPTEDP